MWYHEAKHLWKKKVLGSIPCYGKLAVGHVLQKSKQINFFQKQTCHGQV